MKDTATNSPRRLARFVLRMVLVLLCVHLTATAQPVGAGSETPSLVPTVAPAVPASRQAELVYVITMQGPIDRMTSISVQRRIAIAEAAGADAIVIDIDSPGGEVGAVLEICNAIKSSPIANSLGWVNDEAYSGGAIVALACRRLASTSPASMGDALPILFDPFMGAQRVPEELRAKVFPPVIAELTDSARRYGYDEYLVQAIASDRIELWQVERVGTNPPERFTIDANEYRQVFDAEPPRGKPMLGTIGETSGRAPARPADGSLTSAAEEGKEEASNNQSDAASDVSPPDTPDDAGDADAVDDADADPSGDEPEPSLSSGDAASGDPDATQSTEDLLAPTEPGVAFSPASEELADVSDQISAGLTIASSRPIFDESQRGKWRLVAYVSDGSGPIVVREDQLNELGFDAAIIRDDAELRDYFGATTITRLDESWSESSVRFLTSLPVRGVLIILLLLGVFVEMISPGLLVPSGVALLAFLGLVIPPMLVGMAGWWEVAAILGGMALIAFEVFITPGFGLFGITGLVSLFAGLIGTFTPNAPGAVPGLGSSNALYGAVTTLLAFATAGVVIFFIARNLKSVPFFSRLILDTAATAQDREGIMASTISDDVSPVAVDDTGTAITDLRPVGRVEFAGDVIIEVHASEGYLPAGTRVRVTNITAFQVTVEQTQAPTPPRSDA